MMVLDESKYTLYHLSNTSIAGFLKLPSGERYLYKVALVVPNSLHNSLTTEKALELIWQARDLSRLYMPDEINDYVKSMFNLIKNMYSSQIERNASNSEERKSSANKWREDINKILEQKPYEIFSPYLKLHTKPSK